MRRFAFWRDVARHLSRWALMAFALHVLLVAAAFTSDDADLETVRFVFARCVSWLAFGCATRLAFMLLHDHIITLEERKRYP